MRPPAPLSDMIVGSPTSGAAVLTRTTGIGGEASHSPWRTPRLLAAMMRPSTRRSTSRSR